MRKNKIPLRSYRIFIIFFFTALFLFQLVNLDADPSPIKRFGDISDEGYWLHNARSKVLFGEFTPDELKISYLGAPLYNMLTYGIFKLFGLSYFSGRIISLLSLWSIIIMLFSFFKQNFGIIKATISAGLFGFMHEVLMYSKWGTPLLLEMGFLTAILFFYVLGKNKCQYYLYVSGVSFGLAVLSKLTALLFLPVLIIFLFLEKATNRISFKNIGMLVFGLLLVIVPFVMFFYLPHLEDYKVMFAHYAGGGSLSSIPTIVKSIILSPVGFTLMKYPSAVIVLIAVIFYFIQVLSSFFQSNWRCVLNRLSDIEIYSISWIIGSTLALCLNGQMGSDRRMVHFYIPFFILAVYYIFNNNYKYFTCPKNRRLLKFLSIIILSIPISYYLSQVYYWSLVHWLNTSLITDFSSKKPVFFPMLWALPIGIFFSYLFIINKNIVLKKILVSVFLIINVTLNSIWYGTGTFTLRNASTIIRDYSSSKMFFTGYFAHQLAVGNETLPIWYNIEYGLKNGINNWFHDYSKENYLVFDFEEPNARLDSGYVKSKLFVPSNVHHLLNIYLSPLPFINNYRAVGSLYLVSPTGVTLPLWFKKWD